ncbi:MAG: putative quinol monooxygenase [Caulobacter sp.]|nr:putative quinol monooxygenase [Caulobacter sp.]
MSPHRRAFIAGSVSAVALTGGAAAQETRMYGLIGKMTAQPGQRDALIAILTAETEGMPGCLSYIVARDAKEADALWVTEVWRTQADHQGSLKLPSVQAAIARGRPLIKDMGPYFETQPVGGVGLPA